MKNCRDAGKAREFLALAGARLSECRRLEESKLPNRMIARFAYLSLLYSALSLLETLGLAGDFDLDAPPFEHEYKIMLFHVNFVRTGAVSRDISDALSAAFDIWMDNDRNPVTHISGGDSISFVNLSEKLLSEAGKICEREFPLSDA